jgi:hypothetical protein
VAGEKCLAEANQGAGKGGPVVNRIGIIAQGLFNKRSNTVVYKQYVISHPGDLLHVKTKVLQGVRRCALTETAGGQEQGSTTLQCALRFSASGASALSFSRGDPGSSTACTEIATEMSPCALRFAEGAEGPWARWWPSCPAISCHLPGPVADDQSKSPE